jgi:hypothetical protein
MDIKELFTLIGDGGSAALLVCMFFMNRMISQIARIEKMLQLVLNVWLKSIDNDATKN